MRSQEPRARVSDVMTSDVRTATPDCRLRDIWQMLVDERCHHLPIVENGKPVGIISSRDLVRVAKERGKGKLSGELHGEETAREVMSTDLETISDREFVDVAVDRIGYGDIHALVVLDEKDDLAGIVTHRDLLRYLVD